MLNFEKLQRVKIADKFLKRLVDFWRDFHFYSGYGYSILRFRKKMLLIAIREGFTASKLSK